MFFFFSFFENEADIKFIHSFKNVIKNIDRLPIRWDGKDFYTDLKKRLVKYEDDVRKIPDIDLDKMNEINELILSAVECYLNGMPSKAFKQISKLITKYYNNLSVEDKDIIGYRIVQLDDNKLYNRKRVFHIPFSLRKRIGTNRYSIPGYPCLYLADGFDGCFNEIGYNPVNNYIVSKFKSDKKMKILDLSVNPNQIVFDSSNKIEGEQLRYSCFNYIYSFPLIIACSYIRSEPNLPFAPEYIIPQLLLQCFHERKNKFKIDGIRYLSCNTNINNEVRNFVFLTEYNNKSQLDYCEKLSEIFSFTAPYYTKDYSNLLNLKDDIDSDLDYAHIYGDMTF